MGSDATRVQQKRRTDKEGKGHVSYWPPSWSSTQDHDLCFLSPSTDGWSVEWLDGTEESCHSYEEWRDILFSHANGVDCFIGEYGVDGSGFPWLARAVDDRKAEVKCCITGGVTAIKMRRGNTHVRVGQLYAWDDKWRRRSPILIVRSIRALCTAMEMGTCLTPSELGGKRMQTLWKQGKKRYPHVSRPGYKLRDKLDEYDIAGRVEQTVLSRNVRRCVELDLRSAYASCCDEVPIGTSTYCARHMETSYWDKRYATWFARCMVKIREPLAISPVPIKTGKGAGRWQFPTQPGTYDTWLWREEAEAAGRAGIEVSPLEGWGWCQMSDRLKPWTDDMEEYRRSYEEEGRRYMADLVKRCVTAAIGTLGSPAARYYLTRGCEKGDVPICRKGTGEEIRGPISEWSLHREPWDDSPAPTHIHCYILMRCRLKVYERERDEIEAGNEVVAVNFDAIYVKVPSRLAVGREKGEWKSRTLTALAGHRMFPYVRSIVARELNGDLRVRLPGSKSNSTQRMQLYGPVRIAASSP